MIGLQLWRDFGLLCERTYTDINQKLFAAFRNIAHFARWAWLGNSRDDSLGFTDEVLFLDRELDFEEWDDYSATMDSADEAAAFRLSHPRARQDCSWNTCETVSVSDETLSIIKAEVISSMSTGCFWFYATKSPIRYQALEIVLANLRSQDEDRYKSLRLQTACRAYLSRERVHRRREAFELFPLAALVSPSAIQASCRGYMARKRVRLDRHSYSREGSPQALQAAIRGFFVRRKVGRLGPDPVKLTQRLAVNTMFPALGAQFDGCDCLLHYPDVLISPHKIVRHVVNKSYHYKPLQLASEIQSYLLVRGKMGRDLAVFVIGDTYTFYEVASCHSIDGAGSLLSHHEAREVLMLRCMADGSVRVLRQQACEFLLHMDVEAVDDHRHAVLTRSVLLVNNFQPDNEPAGSHGLSTMVNSRGVLMPREQKAAERRERRAQSKDLRAQGLKPAKIRLPVRYQNLTTQEYHEVVRREREDQDTWLSEHGNRALPASVRQYLRSDFGRTQWINIHALIVAGKSDQADSMLGKLHKMLGQQLNGYSLRLNTHLIEALYKQKVSAETRRNAQLAASSKRVGLLKLAQVDIAADLEQFRRPSLSSGTTLWADDDDLEPFDSAEMALPWT